MAANAPIDVHHHIIPPVYRKALLDAGIGTSAGRAILEWRPEDSLAHMDALGVETGICSISEPALYPLVAQDTGAAKKLARQVNEYMAELRVKYGRRFGAFALLPLPDVDAALEELAYALDVLELDGVGLLSNYHGDFLGDRVFAPLFSELQKRKAAVHVHPSVPPPPKKMPRPEFVPLDYFEEFCFNTTRAAANLILGGTMERCPDVKMVLAHMGGALPYLAWRIQTCYPGNVPQERRQALPGFVYDGWATLQKPVMDYVAQFYYDTALATHNIAFNAVDEVAPGHMCFGSDSFYATLDNARIFISEIETHYCNAAALYAVERGNAEKLFPCFAAKT